MTQEEIDQVQAYIKGIETKHAYQLQQFKKARDFAQEERDKMSTAVVEIWKLCNEQSKLPPEQVASISRQIIYYYAPDFDIPF